ncbi:hypothetical protein Pen01_56050 [Phytomonospora endophytica]|nr:hypothetical protein Pen01_56050 [Phytomonospora endophytica]
MRVAVLRHSLRGQKAAYTASAVVIGLVLAGATIYLGFSDGTALAGLLGLWVLGWAIAPLIVGGGEVLKPENFAVLPLTPRKLAAGLLASSFVGFGPAIALVAFAALLPYAVQAGPETLVVAVPAMLLELAFVVLLARFVNAVAGILLRTHLGAAIVAFVWAGALALLAQGWALVAALTQRWGAKGPAVLDDIVGWLPSGWPVRAVDAAGRGEWGLAAGLLAAMAVLLVVMLLTWARMLRRRLTVKPARPRVHTAGRARLGGNGPVGAVLAKELRGWSRDLLRINHMWFAIVYGVAFCLLPVLVGWWGMAPYTGLVVLVMASGLAANVFGSDGTALWMTLLTPGAARADVRGRQLAWVAVFGPISAVLTVALTAVSGEDSAWPIVLGLLPAALGGAAGLAALVSVYMLIPLTDPHKRGANPLGLGDNEGQVSGLVYVMLLGVPLTCVPAAGALAAGLITGTAWLTWLTVPVGVASGALFSWWFGRLAHHRLVTHGPDLLQAMRTGKAASTRTVRGEDGVKRVLADFKLEDLPKKERTIVGICWGTGWLPLFPQGLVATGMLLFGQREKSWFLATYLGDFAYPVAIAMLLLGLAVYGTALYLPWRYKKSRAAREALGG